jgi:phosphoribosylformylglycinamidine cyclo-ligase
MKEMTYAEAGVDIDLESLAIKAIVSQVKKTLSYRRGKVGESPIGLGHFAGLIKISDERALAVSADGVGSKILVAEMLGKYDTIGIDLIAMNANDIICVGAEPLTLVDYLAMERPDPKITKEIAKGLAIGAEMAGISISGGELATLPEIIKGLDLAGLMIGIVDIRSIVTGEAIKPGDVVVGLESSGIHSNGLTLARKVLLGNYKLEDKIGERSVGEELLMPTKIYVREILDLLRKVKVKGLANITGGGLGNLTRITKYGYFLDSLPEPQAVFKEIQRLGNVSEKEMYRTFNMGIGFCIVIEEEEADKTIKISKKHGTKAYRIGNVNEKEGVRIEGKDFVLKY